MTTLQICLTLLCVVAISCGQLLFKKTGIELQSGNWMSVRVLTTGGLAFVIYALATLLWINLLRHAPLHKAYGFMALSFVLVPIASRFLFEESITRGHMVGTALIVVGVIVCARF